MVTQVCPKCNARYTTMAHSGDFVHNCNIPEADPVAREEDILITHVSFVDFDGSGGKGPTEVIMQSVENKLWGTRAALEGEKDETVTRRGNPVKRYRSRSHLEYIEDPENPGSC